MMTDRHTNKENPGSRGDLSESARDQERLKPEETILDLPDVEDIPGQENFRVLPLGALADTTISSDDEEGKGLFDETENEIMDENSGVTITERQMLRAGETRTSPDETNLRRASLDQTDSEGDALNEKGFGTARSGSDLDIPGSEADDLNESIGEEDEENNSYSLGGQEN